MSEKKKKIQEEDDYFENSVHVYIDSKPSKDHGFSFIFKLFLYLSIVCGIILILQQSLLFYFVSTRSFVVDYENNVFLKDGKPFRYVSGSIHYHRIPSIYWFDRLSKAKALGVDAIQIYVPWNFHEATEGVFNFNGDRDIVKFLEIAKSLDLLVIARVGPYICAEWDFGGLPAWLLQKNASMIIRSSDQQYVAAVNSWFNQLLQKLKPLLYENGGPIIMVQLENEYGSYYTCDLNYLKSLYSIARANLGNEIVLFTTDGYYKQALQCGAMDNRTLATIDFGVGEDPNDAFNSLRGFRSNGPLVNSEYYVGWLDIWGLPHSTVNTKEIINSMDGLLAFKNASVSVNMYMMHGGSTFGFWNGAEFSPYASQVSSYDYDAPISEAGDTGEKFRAIRSLIQKWNPKVVPEIPANVTKKAYGSVVLTERSNVICALNTPHHRIESPVPLSMEAVGQWQGLLVYMADLGSRPSHDEITVQFDRAADTIYLFTSDTTFHWVNYLGMMNRSNLNATFSVPPMHTKLILLAYNEGHINFGSGMFNDVKGIIGNVSVNGQILLGWTMIRMDLESIPVYPLYPSVVFPQQASIHIGHLDVKGEVQDTFLSLKNFTKGFVFINGNNVGRFWNNRGPQMTLYVPKSFLISNRTNIVQILELEGFNCPHDVCYAEFIDYPIIDGPVGKS